MIKFGSRLEQSENDSKMVVIRPELSLDFKPPPYIPKTIAEFLRELSAMDSVKERELKLEDFIKRLEEEMRKIDAFKRELPISMLLINDVILHLKEELNRCKKQNVEPVLEEFIPLKKSCDVEEKDEVVKEKDNRDKMNWMSSVQLWNSADCTNSDSNLNKKQNTVVEIKKITEEENRQVIDDPYKNRTAGRAFMPFKGFSVFPVPVKRKEDKEELEVPGLSLVTPGTTKNPIQELGSSILSTKSNSNRAVSSSSFDGQSNLRTGLQQPPQPQTSRKQRRCWSPELHRRFVNALQQLGGSQAATPKQIRELMQVDGLTNDEVKSHLQKYRLHTRRVPSVASTATNQSLVVLGGLWMGQDQCGESSKQSNSHSGSPQGPLHLATGPSGGTSTTGGDSMEDEEEDGKSECYSWKK